MKHLFRDGSLHSGAWGHSALVGAVWQQSAGLSFDVAVRTGKTSEGS